MNRETFTVDAALLQELGERLIGRAHIALVELIKNAYDADAINCEIRFDGEGISIADDGHGMSDKEFLDHWMRIGTTHKVEMENSKLLNRVLTGSKGIGRLSAQFLASEMELWRHVRRTTRSSALCDSRLEEHYARPGPGQI